MEKTEPLSGNEARDWTILQKVAFRFFFIFISLISWFGYNVINDIIYPKDILVKCASCLGQPLYWLDRHFYHIGYTPGQTRVIIIKDSPVSWVLLITIAWISVIGCIIWSIFDKKKGNYNRLNYWFNTYLAYYLFLSIDFYAIYKIAAIQMPFPNGSALLGPLGHKIRVELLFNFMGVSPGYSIFTGICELLAGLLVLIRRTRVLGCMVMATILINIVCLNLFYNVGVKLLSMQLLLICLYLLRPYLLKLTRFFFRLEPASLAEKQYRFSTPWKNYAITALLLVPVWVTANLAIRSMRLQKTDRLRQQQKLYDVISFVKGTDTLPPLLTDTFRIKRLLFTAYYAHKYAVVYNMNDSAGNYTYTIDTNSKKIILTGRQKGKGGEFCYKELPKKQLELYGKWNGADVSIKLKELDLNSLPIVKEKIIWVQTN